VADPEQVAWCERCGCDLAPDESRLCPSCAILAAETASQAGRAAAGAQAQAASADAEKRPTRRRWIEIAVLIACVAVIAWRLPAILQAADPPAPLRTGPRTTAGDCDGCVANLWTISSALQAGASVPTSLTCPASGAAYTMTGRGDDAVVSCPNPDRHDLASLSVTGAKPMPAAVAR